MILSGIAFRNFLRFDNLMLTLTPGINLCSEGNHLGKTHLLKALYSAAQSVNPKTTFASKLVCTFLPEDYNISRLISRPKPWYSNSDQALVRVYAHNGDPKVTNTLEVTFDRTTTRWQDAKVTGEEEWQQTFAGSKSVFVPTREPLSWAYNVCAAAARENIRIDDTYLDAMTFAKVNVSSSSPNIPTAEDLVKNQIMGVLGSMLGGPVTYDKRKDSFYLGSDKTRTEMSLVSESGSKIALLWLMLKNGYLKRGSVLFWDNFGEGMSDWEKKVLIQVIAKLADIGVQIILTSVDPLVAFAFDLLDDGNRQINHIDLAWHD